MYSSVCIREPWQQLQLPGVSRGRLGTARPFLSILRKADGPDLQLAGFQHIGCRLHAKAVYKTFGIDIDALEFVFGREFDKL